MGGYAARGAPERSFLTACWRDFEAATAKDQTCSNNAHTLTGLPVPDRQRTNKKQRQTRPPQLGCAASCHASHDGGVRKVARWASTSCGLCHRLMRGHWAQTYGMGNKSEMLVAVRAPEGRDGRVAITLTTDLATEAVMHWGVRRGRAQEWLLPPQVIGLRDGEP